MHDQPVDQLGVPPQRTHDSVLVQMYDLDAVAAAFCHRAGDPTAEASRLATLHDVLAASRALAQALETFARAGSVHHRGIHCTADMRRELEGLAHRLSAWSDAVLAAGTARREWELDAGDTRTDQPANLEPRLASAFPGLAAGDTGAVTALPT